MDTKTEKCLGKISQGTWEYRALFGDIVVPKDRIIAEVYNGAADALVMAAAPKLLRALIDMVDRIDYYASLKEREVKPQIEDWAYTYASTDMENARDAISLALYGTNTYKTQKDTKALLEILKISEQDVEEGRTMTGAELLDKIKHRVEGLE